MTLTTKDTNNLFAFTDAIDALKEILEQTRADRDKYGFDAEVGLFKNYDVFYNMQARVEVLEDALEALSTEENIARLINLAAEREFGNVS